MLDVLDQPETVAPVVLTGGRPPVWRPGRATTPPMQRVAPVTIPVIGGRPIDGRRLARAPWAEPLAAFAGVVVETQLVPESWLAARQEARRAPPADEPLAAAQVPAVTPRQSAPARPPVRRPAPVAPPARRGFLARAVMVTVGLVVSLLAYEAAARVGRR